MTERGMSASWDRDLSTALDVVACCASAVEQTKLKRCEQFLRCDIASLPAFSYYDRLKRVRVLVARSHARQITLGEAAAIACMERKYFCGFFHAKVGLTFTQWLRHYRIQRAVEHLCCQDLSVSQVVQAVGFGSQRAFQRAFKDLIGMTPRQFKSLVEPGW